MYQVSKKKGQNSVTFVPNKNIWKQKNFMGFKNQITGTVLNLTHQQL